MRIFRKTYKYTSGKVHIKSDISLNEKQISSIIEIINEVMKRFYYEPCYEISRKIYHEIGVTLKGVETNHRFGRIFIKLKK